MKLISKAGRRGLVTAAIASAAILLPAVALASPAAPARHTAATKSAASYPRCTASRLTSWLGIPGSASAGSVTYELQLSNISRRACTMYGFPGVSALRGGKQLGSASARAYGHRIRTVLVGPGQTAHVVLEITDVYNFTPSACRPTTADTIRVFAPKDHKATQFQFSFEACAKKGPIYLHVSNVLPGAGIPGYSF